MQNINQIFKIWTLISKVKFDLRYQNEIFNPISVGFHVTLTKWCEVPCNYTPDKKTWMAVKDKRLIFDGVFSQVVGIFWYFEYIWYTHDFLELSETIFN